MRQSTNFKIEKDSFARYAQRKLVLHRKQSPSKSRSSDKHSVLVIIKHERLASPEQVILEYLEENETIRNKTAREICHISADYVVKEIFNRLVTRRLIERAPSACLRLMV